MHIHMPWTDQTPCSGSAFFPGVRIEIMAAPVCIHLISGPSMPGPTGCGDKGKAGAVRQGILVDYFFLSSIATAAECKAHSKALYAFGAQLRTFGAHLKEHLLKGLHLDSTVLIMVTP